jgi:secreted PhoX family phosphatase
VWREPSANCSGSVTPWGTVLSGEENFHSYFVADSNAFGSDRYGLNGRPSVYRWEAVEPRFDATQPDYAAELHRFGYIVEIDPRDPQSTPVKHTALGRFTHEGANVRVDMSPAPTTLIGVPMDGPALMARIHALAIGTGMSSRSRAANRASATSFGWNLFLVCGDSDESGRYFGGWQGPVAPISCPDNLTFDSVGNLWIATDGAPGSISKADGLFRVPVEGAERGRVVQFLAVPYQAETCGPVIDDRDGSVFVAVQHPGEEGSWDEQLSYFPDYVPARVRPRHGAWRGPRPSVIQVTRSG